VDDVSVLAELDDVFLAQVAAAKGGDSAAANMVLKYRLELEKIRFEVGAGDWFPAGMSKGEIVDHLREMLVMAEGLEG
jgi:hypothetical protein